MAFARQRNFIGYPPTGTYLWKTNTDIGTFFDAAYFDGKTYIGSNQGIYLYEEDGRKMQTSMYPLQFCNLKMNCYAVLLPSYLK